MQPSIIQNVTQVSQAIFTAFLLLTIKNSNFFNNIYTEKHVRSLKLSLETMIRGNQYGYKADFGLEKLKTTLN